MQKDLVIIGSGPGGYIAAIECAKNNRKVTLIEEADIGGICLNYGCMPTKSLLHSAKEIINLKNSNNVGNISFDNFSISYPNIIDVSRKNVQKLQDGVNFLMKKYNIEVINAHASFLSDNEIKITFKDNSTDSLQFNNAIIATGSKPRELSNIKINGISVHNSKTFLINKKMPKDILVIGSGSIGLEFASFLNALGVNVTIVETQDKIMPQADNTISNTLKRILQDKGIKIYTSANITKFENNNDSIINVSLKDKKNEEILLTFDMCLVSIGVVPNTINLGLENTLIELNEKNFIKVNEHMQTTSKNIYAIGDVIGFPTLAHVASREAIIASQAICNIVNNFNKKVIPYGTYSFPQVASVGITEEEAKTQSLTYKSVRIPFSANGKAIVSQHEEGLIKLIYDIETRKILGCHIIHDDAVELITELVLAINNDLTCDDIVKTIHAHPTLSEAIYEVCKG